MRKSLVLYFYLSPMHCDSNRVLEVLNWRTHDRAVLGLGHLEPGASKQMWMFVPCGNGLYEIMNKNSLCVLNDEEVCEYSGCLVNQRDRHGCINQHWRIKRAGEDGRIQICPRSDASFALGVNESSIILNLNLKHPNQIWRLIRA